MAADVSRLTAVGHDASLAAEDDDASPSRQTRRISKRTSWADNKLPRGPDASDLGGGLRTVRAPTGGAKLARST
jgi:hypothetical protein